MNATFIPAARHLLDCWRVEAEGSRASQLEWERKAEEAERTAEQHARAAERAEAHVEELEEALRGEGITP